MGFVEEVLLSKISKGGQEAGEGMNTDVISGFPQGEYSAYSVSHHWF